MEPEGALRRTEQMVYSVHGLVDCVQFAGIEANTILLACLRLGVLGPPAQRH